jgi:hypothetical protein
MEPTLAADRQKQLAEAPPLVDPSSSSHCSGRLGVDRLAKLRSGARPALLTMAVTSGATAFMIGPMWPRAEQMLIQRLIG